MLFVAVEVYPPTSWFTYRLTPLKRGYSSPGYQGMDGVQELVCDTAYHVVYKNKSYDRHITNLHNWRGLVVPILVHTNDSNIRTGNIVVVLDNANYTHYHLARVLKHTETITEVQYAATAGSQLINAVWQLLYRRKVNNRFIYQFENDTRFNFDDNRSYIGVFNSDERKDFVILNDVSDVRTRPVTRPTPRGFSVLG